MTAARTRIVSRPSRNTRMALLMTTVVWLRRCPAGSSVGSVVPPLRVPAEHHCDHGDGEDDRRPHVEADALVESLGDDPIGAVRALGGRFRGCLTVRHPKLLSVNPTLALGYRPGAKANTD